MTDPSFPPVTRAQWEAKAEKDLGGRPLSSLTRRTADGLAVAPLYMRGDAPTVAPGSPTVAAGIPGEYPGVRGRTPTGPGRGQGWLSVQDYRHADAKTANAAARRDLELGGHGLRFVLDSELRAGRGPGAAPDGLVCDPMTELDVLLDGIDPRRVVVLFDAGLAAPAWADAYEEWLDNLPDADADADDADADASDSGQGPEVELGRGPSYGGVVYDPIAALLTTGSLELDFEGALARTTDTILGMRSGMLGVSTLPYHDAGASEADELALALSTCAELLRRGVGLGLEIGDLCGAMIWTVAVAGRPFEAIAKLRAARLCWAKFSAAAGQPDVSLWIHATSSARNWTRLGPFVNLLRGTVGSFAAAVGGADSMATAAFDGLRGPEGASAEGLGRGSELGRRLALNTQVILREESHLDRVIDPAGGSYYVEALTDALARAAWDRFREIEASGGLVANLVSGSIHARLAASAARLRERAATRRAPLTGLSTFPVLDEQATPAQVANRSTSEGPELQRSGPVLDPAELPRLPRLRLAADYEALRDASEAFAARTGARPKVWAAKLGPLPRHQARTDFARNGFAAGGLELANADGSEGLELSDRAALVAQVQAQFADSGCKLAIICGHDDDYDVVAAQLCVALRAGGAEQVWIAGKPAAEHAWGLDPELPPRFIHLGCDLIAELEHGLGILGVLDRDTPTQEQA